MEVVNLSGGEPLEIFVNREGEVILKKYSLIGVVVISNKTKNKKIGDLELKLANTASSFLARHLE